MGYQLQHYIDSHFHSHLAEGQSGWEFFLHELSQPFGYLPFLAFLLGTLGAYLVYVKGMKLNEFFKKQLSVIYQASLNKWYIDEIYNAIVAALMFIFRWTYKIFERIFIEGIIINGITWRGSEILGDILKVQQTGKIQSYALIMITALGATVAWVVFR
jgi:NADH-quinone oxidoreductase subunit L